MVFKNYVKLTLQCRSNCSNVKEDLKVKTNQGVQIIFVRV